MSREWISSYHFASEDAKALAVDAAGNIYVTGGSSGDYATVKYNSAGFQQWAVRFNAPGNNSDAAVDIAADDSGNVYVTGASYLVSSNNDFVTIVDQMFVHRFIRDVNPHRATFQPIRQPDHKIRFAVFQFPFEVREAAGLRNLSNEQFCFGQLRREWNTGEKQHRKIMRVLVRKAVHHRKSGTGFALVLLQIFQG